MTIGNATPDGMPCVEAITAVTTHLDSFVEGIDYLRNPHYTPAMPKDDEIMISEQAMFNVIDWLVKNEYPKEITNLRTGKVICVRYDDKSLIDSIAPCLKKRTADTAVMILEHNKRYGRWYQIRCVRNGVTESIMDKMPVKIGEAAIGVAKAIDTINSKENGINAPSGTIFVTRDSFFANYNGEFNNQEMLRNIEKGVCTGFVMGVNGRRINIAVV